MHAETKNHHPSRDPSPSPSSRLRRDLDKDLDAIAHDVINTVTAISGRAQLTRRRVEKIAHLDREHIASDLRAIEEHAVRACFLVEACRGLATGTLDESDGETLHSPRLGRTRGTIRPVSAALPRRHLDQDRAARRVGDGRNYGQWLPNSR